MSVDESNIVKKITLGSVDIDENTFNDETKNIGAEAENIIVSYNNHNEIITDLAHNTVDHNEPLAITLRDMKSTFQAGVDTIVEGETSRGLTPAGSTPQALSDAVGDALDYIYSYIKSLPNNPIVLYTGKTLSNIYTAARELTTRTANYILQRVINNREFQFEARGATNIVIDISNANYLKKIKIIRKDYHGSIAGSEITDSQGTVLIDLTTAQEDDEFNIDVSSSAYLHIKTTEDCNFIFQFTYEATPFV